MKGVDVRKDGMRLLPVHWPIFRLEISDEIEERNLIFAFPNACMFGVRYRYAQNEVQCDNGYSKSG